MRLKRTFQHELMLAAMWLLTACSVYDPEILTSAAQGSSQAGRGALGDGGVLDCQASQSECSRPHAVAACVNGKCLVASCDAPFVDCDENPDNGCEADLGSAEHCGLCNATCRFSHAAASCTDGQCTLADCEPGYDDCDGDRSNGCERSLRSIRDCGACNKTCDKPAYATATCDSGKCAPRCEPGHGDCNVKVEDGCEQPLTVNDHCGTCEMRCDGPHVSAAECTNGRCVVITCAAGFADCNGDPADGCEADLSGPANCGACSATCELPHVTAPRCNPELRSCLIGCAPGELDCVKTENTGCASGYADCDGKTDNGCETDLTRLSSCGKCGNSCVVGQTTTECRNGSCQKTGCSPGYGSCGENSACQALLTDNKNCGGCGMACDTSAPNCSGGRCTTQTCAADVADCDNNPANACETNLHDPAHCGGCDIRCGALPHATVSCAQGSCQIGSCDAGYADCDHDPSNGCEVGLNSADDCGACGQSCAYAQADASCESGVCKLKACKPDRADCDGNPANGCEADLRLPENCGTCGNNCGGVANVAAASCTAGKCQARCQNGFADCNENPADGCEVNLSLGDHCGSCATDCTQLPNTDGAGCSEGACRSLVCTAGYGDCDGDTSNGCERSVRSVTDCGMCDRPCAPAHAAADCSGGQCTHGACDTGFGDCDGNAENGCETALTSSDHCGSCGTSCGAGVACRNGQCGCTRDDQCGGGTKHCCNSECVDTEGTCFPWPCIPGTSLQQNRANCGACGALCITFCCST